MKISVITSFTIFIFSLLATADAANPVERPPQYVILSFDGALNVDMWNETLTFAKQNNVKHSFFMSGVYFLLDDNRSDYTEPTLGPGKSNIGFAGDSKKNLVTRVDFVNKAYDEGHDIASHANGHFDATTWSLANWEWELKEFNHLIFNVFTQKGFETEPANPYHFAADEIIGFRAPLLATNSNLYKILQKSNYRYDTSQTNSMNYWPKNLEGIWNFSLADIRIFNTGKTTLTMDYNFYFSQSGAKPDLKNMEKYREEMLNTYMGYFYTNYYGNRAPLHIGHHFSKWNGGAYSLAFDDFAKSVCGIPEVKCVSYKSLVKFMDSLTPTILVEYQKGNFPKLPISPDQQKYVDAVALLDVSFLMNKVSNEEIEVSIQGKDALIFPKNATYIWKLNNKEILRSKNTRIKFAAGLKIRGDTKLSASLNYNGRELLKTSHIIRSSDSENFILFKEDLEKRASLGDLPEAHTSEMP